MEEVPYRSASRVFLEKRGEKIDKEIWGNIKVEGYIDDDGDYHAFFKSICCSLEA